MALAEQDQPVEAFLFDGPHESFRIGIAVRCSRRCSNDPNVLMFQQGLDRAAPLGIAVADQKSPRSHHAVHRVGHLPYGLKHERFVWIPCGTTDTHSPRVQFDDEHRVVGYQPTPRPDFGREEVGGDERRPMRAQECVPRCRPLTTWWNAFGSEDGRDRRPGNTMPDVLQRSLDPRVSPLRIVSRHPHDEPSNRCRHARSP